MKRRVVITGIGVIAPNGIGKENFWNALKEGKNGIKKISLFDASELPVQIAGEVSDFRPEEFIDKKKIKRMARFTQFAVASAKMAIEDSGLNLRNLNPESILFALGVSTSAMDFIETQHRRFLKRGYRSILPYGIYSATPNIANEEILSELNIEASTCTIATGCAAGLDSIGLGYREIKNGNFSVVIAGGSDASITPLIIAGLAASKIMSTRNECPEKASRPFDKLRDGGVLSEGGAILVLEELSFALARKAKIYAEIVGYGQIGEMEISKPGVGLERAMERCIQNAFIEKKLIDCIFAHGPSDPLLDYLETVAIKKVFGEYAYKIPITSIKSMVGNPFSSGGVMQVIGGIMSCIKNVIPPTINYEFPDPNCDLDYVPNRYRIAQVNYCLINSHGLGGGNSSLLIKRYKDE